LFRDNAARVLKHYRGLVDQIENEAKVLAQKKLEEESNRQFYFANQETLDREYQYLLEMNMSKTSEVPAKGYHALVDAWTRGGASELLSEFNASTDNKRPGPFLRLAEAWAERRQSREEQRRLRLQERALKEAAKVVVDYRPVMSRIIDGKPSLSASDKSLQRGR
jgi:hypothetical protein